MLMLCPMILSLYFLEEGWTTFSLPERNLQSELIKTWFLTNVARLKALYKYLEMDFSAITAYLLYRSPKA